MTLQSRLIAMQTYAAGEPVGYGGTWRCPRDSRIGVAAIGYGDGYPRHAPSGTPVLVSGRRAALAGRVSMDMITIDLTDHPEASVGDPVILWGRGLPAEEIARQAGTIPYELFCQVTQRVVFVEIEYDS
jgi:alanine racemase